MIAEPIARPIIAQPLARGLVASSGGGAPVANVFVFAGQSNAVTASTSLGTVPPALATPDPSVKIWNVSAQAWQTYAAGTNSDQPTVSNFWGPEGEFCRQYRLSYPSKTVYIIKYAMSGTYLAQDAGSSDWSPSSSGELFALAKAEIVKALAAISSPVIGAVVWIQGEQDAFNVVAYANAYQTNLPNFIAQARTQWVPATTKFVIARMSLSPSWTYGATVRAAQLTVTNADSTTQLVSEDAYSLTGDHIIPADIATFAQQLWAGYRGIYNPSPTDITITWGGAYANGSIPQNTATSTVIGALSATNAVCGGPITWSEVTDPDSAVSISGSNLVLTRNLSGESVGTTHSFSLRATNTLTRTYDKSFTITVAAGAVGSTLLSGLVSYWKLDETSGTRSDSVGSNQLSPNGTLSSGTGKIGNAASFTAANQAILNCPSNSTLNPAGSFTLAFWVNFSSKTADRTVLGKGVGGDAAYYIYYELATNKVTFDVVKGPGYNPYYQIYSNTLGSPTTGTWYLFVCMYDDSAKLLKMRINNVAETDTSGGAGSLYVTGQAFGISYVGTNSMDGLIDEVGYWNRVLTVSEQTELWNGGAGKTHPFAPSPLLTGLVAYWKLDEASGSRADSSGVGSTLSQSGVAVNSASGKVGSGANFVPANNSWLRCVSNANLQMGDIDFTITLWVKFNSLSSTCTLLSKDNAANWEYDIYMSANTVRLYMDRGASSATVVSATTMTTGVWYFGVAIHDSVNDVIKISVDNAAFTSSSFVGGPGVTTGNFGIGAESNGTNLLDGIIDEVGIWKRVLSASEITTLYNGGAGLTYPF